jgi:hypothetical protein
MTSLLEYVRGLDNFLTHFVIIVIDVETTTIPAEAVSRRLPAAVARVQF